jgi:hypothetical protein
LPEVPMPNSIDLRRWTARIHQILQIWALHAQRCK